MSAVIKVIQYPATVVRVITAGPQGPAGTGLDTLTTKGDTLGHNGTTAVRVPVGTNGQVLTADSTAAPGVKWSTPGDLATGNTTDEDIEITDMSKGFIRKSPNGTRWRLGVSDTGLSIWTPLAALVFLAATLCGASAQTLGLGTTTNGTVVSDRTNVLTFSNALGWSTNTLAAQTRTNLGLGASWLTNATAPTTTNAGDLTAGTLADARLSSNVALLPNLPAWATNTNAQTAEAALFSNGLTLPSVATTNAGDIYRLANGLFFRNSTNAEERVLVASANLANLTSPAAARTNLGVTVASNLPAPWSGAAVSNAPLLADGAGGSAFSSRVAVSRVRTANSATVTNQNTFIDDGVLEATVTSGRWRVTTFMAFTSPVGNIQPNLLVPHNVVRSRMIPRIDEGGNLAGGFNSDTNILWSADGTSGTRGVAIYGAVFVTNTSTIKARLQFTAGASNSVTMLSNSFLTLEPLP